MTPFFQVETSRSHSLSGGWRPCEVRPLADTVPPELVDLALLACILPDLALLFYAAVLALLLNVQSFEPYDQEQLLWVDAEQADQGRGAHGLRIHAQQVTLVKKTLVLPPLTKETEEAVFS